MSTTIEKLEDCKKKGEFLYRVISRSPNLAIGIGVVIVGCVVYVWNRKSKKLETLITDEDIQLQMNENMEECRRIAARDEELSQAEFEKLMKSKQRKFKPQLLNDKEDYEKYEDEHKKIMEEIERKYEENMKQLEENLPFIGQDKPVTTSSQNDHNEIDDTSSDSSGAEKEDDLDFDVIENDEQYQSLTFSFSRLHVEDFPCN